MAEREKRRRGFAYTNNEEILKQYIYNGYTRGEFEAAAYAQKKLAKILAEKQRAATEQEKKKSSFVAKQNEDIFRAKKEDRRIKNKD